MTPATIKQFVIMYDNTINNLMQATLSASDLLLPDFSPSALAIILHIILNLSIQKCSGHLGVTAPNLNTTTFRFSPWHE